MQIKKDKVLLIALLLLSLIMFFYRLGAPSLFETDEVIYSQISKQIVQSGDWITLRFFNEKWFIHPPLYMWLISASSYLFGTGEFNTRLWNALFAVGLVYITYLLGRKMFKDGVGLLAGFILATSLQYLIQARIAVFDIPEVFFMTASILFFIHWLEDNKPAYYYLSFLAMGLAVLTKGPVGIVLPVLVLTAYLAATKELNKLFNPRLIIGFIIAYIIGGTWYTAELILHGREFIDSIFGFYTLERYFRPIETHYGPWYFYIFVVVFGFIPWISFLPYSIKYQWKMKGDNDNLFTVLWLGIVFLFFTLAGTKLPGYIMPFYPFAAISVAKMISDHISGEDSGLDMEVSNSHKTLLIFSLILLFIGISARIFESPEGYETIISNLSFSMMIIGIGGLTATYLFKSTRKVLYSVIVLGITMFIFSIYTANFTMITLDDFKPMKLISQKVRSQYMNGEVIIGYRVLNKGSFQYYMEKNIKWLGNPQELAICLKNTSGRIYLITNISDYLGIDQDIKKLLFLVYRSGDMVLISNMK